MLFVEVLQAKVPTKVPLHNVTKVWTRRTARVSSVWAMYQIVTCCDESRNHILNIVYLTKVLTKSNGYSMPTQMVKHVAKVKWPECWQSKTWSCPWMKVKESENKQAVQLRAWTTRTSQMRMKFITFYRCITVYLFAACWQGQGLLAKSTSPVAQHLKDLIDFKVAAEPNLSIMSQKSHVQCCCTQWCSHVKQFCQSKWSRMLPKSNGQGGCWQSLVFLRLARAKWPRM